MKIDNRIHESLEKNLAIAKATRTVESSRLNQ
jgi:hypothetical protein